MIYQINESPKTFKEWILYTSQQVLSVFVATVLIATICGTPPSACLLGACVGTLTYQILTNFKSPMFISSCGATAGAVIAALSINGYTAVIIGGLIMFIVYWGAARLIQYKGIESINKLLPPTIIGTITLVIGINLAGFIPTYLQSNGEITFYGTLVSIFTMFVIAFTAHKGKGILKNIPFLIGLLSGYILASIITLCGFAKLVDFSVFHNLTLFQIPDLTFKYVDWSFASLNLPMLVQLIAIYVPVSLAGICEHMSDHKVLSNILNVDLTKEPGLDKTLRGDGLASLIGSILCGLQNTSYGESIATIGFSKVASVLVITMAALTLGIMSFIAPIQAFILSIPSVCFAGAAMVLYGYIASSGLRTLLNSHIDFSNNKTLVLISAMLTSGVSGMYLFHEAFSGVSLALVIGIILNICLKDEKK